MDILQAHTILALEVEVKAIRQKPWMDVLISFQEAYVTHLHSHRSHSSMYLVLLLRETSRWLYPIAPHPIWHATGGTYLLLLTCNVTEIVHTMWMFAKTVLLQVLKMTRKAQRETPVPSFHTMSDLIKLLAIMLLLHALDARLSRVRLETTWTDPRGVRQALLPEPTQHCKYLFKMMEPWPGLNQMKRMVMIRRTTIPNHRLSSRLRKDRKYLVRDDGTMAGLESDEENDDDSKDHRSKPRAIIANMKGNPSKLQAITATTTHDAECVSDP